MAVRQDKVQINIAFLTDESKEYARLIQSNKDLIKDFRSAQKEGKDLGNIVRQIADSGNKLEKLDLSNVAPSQLISRAKQLQQILQFIPKSTPEAKRLADELKRVNDQLATNKAETRGVAAGAANLRTEWIGVVGRFAAGATAIIASLRGVGKALDSAGDFEQYNIAFETFIGNGEEAKQLLQDLNQFATRTPFQQDEVIRAGRALLAFGFDVKEVTPLLDQIGNVAAGTGKDFNELVQIFGKARAANLIQGDELNQLAEAGIPIYEELSKVLNVNVEDIRKLGEQGKIQFTDLQAVFNNLTREGGRFNNLIQKQSESFKGLLSTAKDAFANLTRSFGEALLPAAKTVLNTFINLINRVTGANKTASQSVADLQAQFNIEIETLKRGNLSQENRARLIESINTKYKDYLPNLITEKDTIAQLAAAQEEANKRFAQKITFLAAEEQLVEVRNKQLKAQKEEYDLAIALEKARARQVNATGLSAAGQASVQNPALLQAQSNLDRNKRLQEELQKQFDETLKSAQDLGLDIETILGGGETEAGPISRSLPVDAEKAAKELEKRFQEALKAAENYTDIRLAIQERELLKGTVNESDYQKAVLNIQREGYLQQLGVFADFNRSRTLEAEQTINKLIEVEKELQGREKLALPEAFKEVKATPTPTRERDTRIKDVKEITEAIAKNEEELTKKIQAEEEKRAEYRKNTMQAAGDAVQSFFDLQIELLSGDDEARKRNADRIRQAEKAKVLVAGVQEVQSIWAYAAEAFGPAAPVIGAILTGIAVARTALAINKIDAQKFAKGGLPFGSSHAEGGIALVDSRSGLKVGEMEGGEAIINKRSTSMFRGLLSQINQAGGGVPLMEHGGIPKFNTGGLDTTPVGISFASQAPFTGAAPDLAPLLDRFDRMTAAFQAFPRELKAKVVYTELEDTAAEVTSIRDDAAI